MYSMNGVRQELVMVTPEMARHLAKSAFFSKQRGLSDSHVDRLATEMRKGRFIAGTQVHFAVVSRQLFLINGQHTMAAVAESGETVPLSLLYTDCANMDDVGALYARHDIHRRRDWSAALRSAGMYDAMQANSNFINAVGSAIRFIIAGLDRPHFRTDDEAAWSRDLRIKAMRDYTDEAMRLYAAIHEAPPRTRKLIMRAATLAVALETMRFQPATASDFWGGATRNDGLRRDDPRKTLVEWLADNPSRGGTVGQSEAIRVAAICWNAFFEKRALSIIRLGAVEHFRIAGTPYSEGRRPELDFMKAEIIKPAPQLIKMGRTTAGAPETVSTS